MKCLTYFIGRNNQRSSITFPNIIDIHINATDTDPDATKLMIVNGAFSINGNMKPFNPKKINEITNEYFTLVKKGFFLCATSVITY